MKSDKTQESYKALIAQKDQREKMSNRLSELSNELSQLTERNDSNNQNLDELLLKAKLELQKQREGNLTINEEKLNLAVKKLEGLNFEDKLVDDQKEVRNNLPSFEPLEIINTSEEWETYMENILTYADKNHIDLSQDPFDALMTKDEKNEILRRIQDDYTMESAHCDKYDYMIASFCGSIGGLIDVFFVGMPGDSKLSHWTDERVDQFIKSVAKILKYKPKDGIITVENALTFLENRFKVNYDQATGKAAEDALGMSPKNHHIKSLGHAPDLIGLLFSILDQFTGDSHFLDNSHLIIHKTDKMELKGNNFVSKIFCGFCNWLGHLISDMGGSSSTRRKGEGHRGTGIPMPLFELFQLIGKGKFRVYDDMDKSKPFEEVTFSDLAVKVFEQGYDARFALTQAIPVFFTEMSIRLLWALKAKFYEQKSLLDSMPFGNRPELRRMLLTGHGVLCLIDVVDAGLKSQGQMLIFILRLNFTAWKRLAYSGILEIRSIYKENALDINSMEKDLQNEWLNIYNDSMI